MDTNKGVLKEVYPNTKNNSQMIPLCYSESHVRYLKGEVFLKR